MTYANCRHCGNPAETGTADELGAPYCPDCADLAVYGAGCPNCGNVPGPRPCTALAAERYRVSWGPNGGPESGYVTTETRGAAELARESVTAPVVSVHSVFLADADRPAAAGSAGWADPSAGTISAADYARFALLSADDHYAMHSRAYRESVRSWAEFRAAPPELRAMLRASAESAAEFSALVSVALSARTRPEIVR